MKNSWRLLKLFFRPMLILSLGLHSLILAIPIPDFEESQIEEALLEEPKTIQVSRLPISPEPEAITVKPAAVEESPEETPETPKNESTSTEPPISVSDNPPEPEPEEPPPEPAPKPEPEEIPPAPEAPENLSAPAIEPPALEERLKDSLAYAYNPTGTTDEEATGEYTRWFTEILAEYNDLLPEKEDPIDILYRLGECLPQAPISASVGVIVDENEEIITITSGLVDNPHLLNSTGYSVLDEQAIEAVQNHTFPDKSGIKAYSFEVRVVDYDSEACNSNAS